MNETKTWKKIKIFDTYEEAAACKVSLLSADTTGELLVKIRRCGPEGSNYKVKTWTPPVQKNKKKKE